MMKFKITFKRRLTLIGPLVSWNSIPLIDGGRPKEPTFGVCCHLWHDGCHATSGSESTSICEGKNVLWIQDCFIVHN